MSDHDQLREALKYIDPANREDWVAVGHGLKADNPNNLPHFLSFSRGDYWGKKPDNYVDDADVIYAWNGFQPSRSGVNTVIALAIRRGYHPTSSRAPLRLGSPVEVARIMLDETQKADGIAPVHSEGSFWRYNGAFWGEWAPSEMRTTIHTFDGAKADRGRLKIGSSFVDGVLKELAAMVHDQNFFSEASIGLNLRNGFARYLAAGGVDLGPHSPDHRQRFALPHDFCVPPAEIPDGHIQTFLHGCFGRDNTSFHQLILEVIGAALSGMNTRMKAPKAFVLHGVTAANGKSTLQAIIRAILPKGAICSVAPADLGDPQFLASLAGKQVNLSDELSGSKAIASDRFKAVITGDPVQAKVVYREPFTFTPSAVHVFAANVLPSFAGGVDNGLKRRLVVIPFGRSIPEQDRIPDLAEKIVERQGGLLISMALQAASEAFAAGIYTIPKDCAEATEQWFVDVDPVHEWYEDGGLQAHVSKNGMLLKDLYVKFREDGASHGLRFLPSKRRFVQRIRQLIDEDPEWRIVRRKNGEAVVPAALL